MAIVGSDRVCPWLPFIFNAELLSRIDGKPIRNGGAKRDGITSDEGGLVGCRDFPTVYESPMGRSKIFYVQDLRLH